MALSSAEKTLVKTVIFFTLPLLAYLQTAAIAAPDFLICVSNEKSGTVPLISGKSHAVVATIPVGKRPRGIHPSPDGKLLFVALSGSPINGPRPGSVGDDDAPKKPDRAADGIGVIDLQQKKFLRKLPAGSDPEQFAVSPDGAKLYIANEDAGALTVLSVADGQLGPTLPVAEEPEGVAFTPNGKLVYVTCETHGEVLVLDPAQNKVVASLTVGGRPRSVAFLPDGTRAFVPSESTGIITLVDPAEPKILREIRLPQNSRPMCVAMAPGGKTLYVSTGWAGTVCELNTRTAQVTRAIKVGPRPWGLALSPDGRELYTANGPSNDISIADLAQGKEIARLPVGKSPWGVAVAAPPSN